MLKIPLSLKNVVSYGSLMACFQTQWAWLVYIATCAVLFWALLTEIEQNVQLGTADLKGGVEYNDYVNGQSGRKQWSWVEILASLGIFAYSKEKYLSCN